MRKILLGLVLAGFLTLSVAILFRFHQERSNRNIPYPPWTAQTWWTEEERKDAEKLFGGPQELTERLIRHYVISKSVLDNQEQMESILRNLSAGEVLANLKQNPLNTEAVRWGLVSAKGRMDLPAILIQSQAWDGEGVEFIRFPNRSVTEHEPVIDYYLDWMLFSNSFTEEAFAVMAADSKRSEVTTIDVIRAVLAKGSTPGDPKQRAPRKEDWLALYQSKNPCYRIIALEYFTSVPQTDEEGLALSRECLMEACSYFEVRGMRYLQESPGNIDRKIALLREFIDSNPVDNDGTGYWSRPMAAAPGGWHAKPADRARALIQLLQDRKNKPVDTLSP